jgi:hypothetical protein
LAGGNLPQRFFKLIRQKGNGRAATPAGRIGLFREKTAILPAGFCRLPFNFLSL